MNCALQTKARLLAVALMAVGASPGASTAEPKNTLLVYPVPMQVMYQLHNDDYTVRVRTAGGEWKDLYEYRIRVDWDAPQNASMVYFDFEGAVDIEVQKNNGTFANVSVAPLASEVRLHRGGSIVRATLTKPERFSLQFDDDRLHNLHILAGALPSPRPAGENVRYFEPGVHTPPSDSQNFPVQSGDRIYLAGGAILRGAFELEGVEDVEISGRAEASMSQCE